MKINRKAVLATAVTRWDDDSECYITESPLCREVLGADETAEGAERLFRELLDDLIDDILAGKIPESVRASRAGRPNLGKTRLHAEIRPEARKVIQMLCEELQISQGDAIEFLTSRYQAEQSLKKVSG